MKEVIKTMLEHPIASVILIGAIGCMIDRLVHNEDRPLIALIHVTKTEVNEKA